MTTLDTLLRVPRVRRGRLPVGLVVAAVFIVAVVAAALAPAAFTPHDPERAQLDAVFEPPSFAHPFGTDQLGRDVLTRVIYGAQASLLIGLGAAALALTLGLVVGLLAVYLPFGLDRALQRGIDILLAFPELLLALLVIAVLGRGPVNTLVAVGLSGLAGYARLVRSQVLAARASGWAEHARVLGEHPVAVVVRRVVPNIARPLTVLATLSVGTAVLAASSLSFLGLGVTPPSPEWGAILAEARSQLAVAPWTSFLPATVVAATVISVTVLGRALQARLTEGARS